MDTLTLVALLLTSRRVGMHIRHSTLGTVGGIRHAREQLQEVSK